MPATKRPHERGPSLSLRPHKSVRAGQDGDESQYCDDDQMAMDSNVSSSVTLRQPPSLWEELHMISTSEPLVVPPLNFLGRLVRPLSTFDVSGVTAWPSSLGAIKRYFRYNLTPQRGFLLPSGALDLTAWRRIAPSVDNPGQSLRVPYLHLGFAEWMNIDVFVFLPHLPLVMCEGEDPGRIQEIVLEAWTDRIWLPAMYAGDARAPSSWRMSKMNQFSTLWYDSSIANFPTFKFHSGQELADIWEKVLQNSTSIPEFQNPFIVMHMDKRQSGMFVGENPEVVFQEFEQAWMKEIDTRYIGLDQENLKISVSCDIVV